MNKKQNKGNALAVMQRLGGAMMLPISMLPAAGLLLGLGYGLCNAQLLALFPGMATGFWAGLSALLIAVSGAIFNNLPAIFAVGVAVSLSDDGACGLAGLVALFTMNLTTNLILGISDEVLAANSVMYAKVMGVNTLQTGVFGGILCGILAYQMYKRFKDVKIPQYLGFFGGKRLIPIVSTIAAIFLGVILSFVWPVIQNGIFSMASGFLSSDNPSLLAVFLYGFAFKLLGIVGLHHLIYPIYYYQLGTYTALDGTVVVGDWNIYFRQLADGVPVTAGACMSGSFVIYMIGLLGVAYAIYKNAKPENREKIAGLMITSALASSITGITEPLEYSFAFTALPLYLVHSVMTGLGYMLCPALGIHVGTSFSGGLIDYILCSVIPGAPRWFLVLPLGAAFAVAYYFIFSFLIRKFDFATPGREDEEEAVQEADVVEDELPYEFLKAFGGPANIATLNACFTRLRVSVNDEKLVDEKRFKALGSKGVLHVGDTIQVIIGTHAAQIKDQMKAIIADPAQAAKAVPDKKAPAAAAELRACLSGEVIPVENVPDETFAQKILGDGIAIEPSDTTLVAPCDGTISTVSEGTDHACGMTTADGLELLMHIGIDTVDMNGAGFTCLVKSGDEVKCGDALIRFDPARIRAAGHPVTTMLLVTDDGGREIRFRTGMQAQAGSTVVAEY